MNPVLFNLLQLGFLLLVWKSTLTDTHACKSKSMQTYGPFREVKYICTVVKIFMVKKY